MPSIALSVHTINSFYTRRHSGHTWLTPGKSALPLLSALSFMCPGMCSKSTCYTNPLYFYLLQFTYVRYSFLNQSIGTELSARIKTTKGSLYSYQSLEPNIFLHKTEIKSCWMLWTWFGLADDDTFIFKFHWRVKVILDAFHLEIRQFCSAIKIITFKVSDLLIPRSLGYSFIWHFTLSLCKSNQSACITQKTVFFWLSVRRGAHLYVYIIHHIYYIHVYYV